MTKKVLMSPTPKTRLVAEYGEFNGEEVFSVRTWVHSKKAGTWVRTMKGFNVPAVEALDLARAILAFAKSR